MVLFFRLRRSRRKLDSAYVCVWGVGGTFIAGVGVGSSFQVHVALAIVGDPPLHGSLPSVHGRDGGQDAAITQLTLTHAVCRHRSHRLCTEATVWQSSKRHPSGMWVCPLHTRYWSRTTIPHRRLGGHSMPLAGGFHYWGFLYHYFPGRGMVWSARANSSQRPFLIQWQYDAGCIKKFMVAAICTPLE